MGELEMEKIKIILDTNLEFVLLLACGKKKALVMYLCTSYIIKFTTSIINCNILTIYVQYLSHLP
jgi:hypothetical protein